MKLPVPNSSAAEFFTMFSAACALVFLASERKGTCLRSSSAGALLELIGDVGKAGVDPSTASPFGCEELKPSALNTRCSRSFHEGFFVKGATSLSAICGEAWLPSVGDLLS
jgi:hypothetical protein